MDLMQRLIEQPFGEGVLVEEDARVGRVHYHLDIDEHVSGNSQPVPPHTEVEGRLTGLDDLDMSGLYGLGFEWTLHLADGRALDFDFVDDSGVIHSSGRGLYLPTPRGGHSHG